MRRKSHLTYRLSLSLILSNVHVNVACAIASMEKVQRLEAQIEACAWESYRNRNISTGEFILRVAAGNYKNLRYTN